MKKRLLITSLAMLLAALLATDTSAEEADDEFILEELKKLTESLKGVQQIPILSESDDDEDNFDDQERYDIGEVVEIKITTGTYDNEEDTSKYESIQEYLVEGRVETFEGFGTIELLDVIRGDEVIEYISPTPEDPSRYHTHPLKGYEWVIIPFEFEWVESEDTRPMTLFALDFAIFDMEGEEVDNVSYKVYNEDAFQDMHVSVGDKITGDLIKLVPRDEPFVVRFGDDIFFDRVYFDVE